VLKIHQNNKLDENSGLCPLMKKFNLARSCFVLSLVLGNNSLLICIVHGGLHSKIKYIIIPLIQKLILCVNPDMSAADEHSPKSGSRSPRVFSLTIVVSPDPLSSAPSNSSSVETLEPQSPGPSVFLIKTEGL
jgi:hypothetical protein